ncbi:putative Tigger transposable element-derived protein 1-like 335 [Homarus americanus]|uniref:Putative Tigger transposable element-derived protein 1-like 335 n=1 Tax=Homarus americanus TaxID=6706 RepID=A0A8J5JMF6_HOMAM|nr:putative Tigger transposable element-derived protein 1-like 335 [Homarus americanus]
MDGMMEANVVPPQPNFHSDDDDTDEDLQQLVDSEKIEDAEDEEVQDAKPRELPTSVLSSILREVDTQLQRLEDNDYNAERSRIAVRGVKSFLAPYEQLLCERRKTAKQQTLDVFFKSTPKKQTEDTEPQPSTSGIRLCSSIRTILEILAGMMQLSSCPPPPLTPQKLSSASVSAFLVKLKQFSGQFSLCSSTNSSTSSSSTSRPMELPRDTISHEQQPLSSNLFEAFKVSLKEHIQATMASKQHKDTSQ